MKRARRRGRGEEGKRRNTFAACNVEGRAIVIVGGVGIGAILEQLLQIQSVTYHNPKQANSSPCHRQESII